MDDVTKANGGTHKPKVSVRIQSKNSSKAVDSFI